VCAHAAARCASAPHLQEVAALYNDWAESAVDAEEEGGDDEEDEDEDEDTEDDDEDDAEEGEIVHDRPAKKAKVSEAPAYAIPTADTLCDGASTLLASHLNVARPQGHLVRVAPYAAQPGEHFVTVFVVQDDDIEE